MKVTLFKTEAAKVLHRATARVMIVVSAAGMLSVHTLSAQHAGVSLLHGTGPLPSFEVATIKPWHPGSPVLNDPAGKSDVAHVWGNTQGLILRAYQALTYGGSTIRIFGWPDWVRAIPYQVEAKIPDDIYLQMQKMTLDDRTKQQSLMLQALLANRFKLKVHFEKREMPVYDLVLAKGGPKLPPPVDPAPKPSDPGAKSQPENTSEHLSVDYKTSQLKVSNEPLEQVFMMPWSGQLNGHMVVNKTGLTGRYSFDLELAPETHPDAPPPPSGPVSDSQTSIFSVAQQLGLKLVPNTAEVEVLVIDHIEPPTEN